MAPRQRSVLTAAAVCVALVLTLLLLAAPPPDELRQRVLKLASFARGPEEAAERANEDAEEPGDGADGADGGGDTDPQPFDDFYGGFPMFGDMMDVWLRDNISRLLKNGEHRFGRRELAKNLDMLVEEKDKT